MAGYGLIVLALAALAAAGVAGYLAFDYRRRLIATEQELARARVAEAALAVAPVGCFVFAGTQTGARCSSWLAEALGCGEGPAADFAAVLGALSETDGERLAAAVDRLNADGSAFTMAVQRQDGSRDFDVSGAPGPDAGGAVLWFADVTTPRRALAEAEAQRDAHARLLDALPLPIWRRDADLSLVYCNLAYARAVDRDRDTAIGEGIELPGTALAEASRGLARRVRQSGTGHSENHHAVVGGERRLLELSEQPLDDGTAGCAFDQTHAEELQGQLTRHIAAHAEILETLGSAIAIYGPDMRLKFFNRSRTTTTSWR
jgi:PAS domain-containing protein